MTEPVFATATGRAYHATETCAALSSGQALSDWDFDYEFPPPTGARLPVTHAVEATTPQQATAVGKHPCTTCKPPGAEPPASGETFGHEPVQMMRDGWGYDSAICIRCRLDGRDVPWPCTSAIVLGLVAHPASATDGGQR
jgi:hypothetical protein